MLLHDGANGVDYWPGWNPIEDDGDALRLAVKLNIQIDSDAFNNDVVVLFTHQPLASDLETLTEPHNDDPYSATRRAIVRAAAEIGKNMK